MKSEGGDNAPFGPLNHKVRLMRSVSLKSLIFHFRIVFEKQRIFFGCACTEIKLGPNAA